MVYLREAYLLPHLDQWLARLFDPDHLDPTLDALEQASNDHTATTQQLDAAEQAIADSKRQLAQYRAALGAGADPTEVTAWLNQATAAKAAAEAERARLRATPTTIDRAALRRILTQAGGLLTALDIADRTRARRCTTSSASGGLPARRTARGRHRRPGMQKVGVGGGT
jgi:site-specific DNA recombinase